MKKKSLALLMAVVMLFGVTVGGTLAWLYTSTSTVTNTFTVGDIKIVLDEKDTDDSKTNVTVEGRDTANKYDIVPGTTYEKDPTVTVKANSEPCYLFVKFEEVGNPSTYYTYTSNLTDTTVWTPLDGVAGVYYKTVDTSTADQSFLLLASQGTGFVGGIKVKDTVKLADMTSAGAAQLKWTAYAVQKENFATAKAAWDATFGATNP